MRQAKTWKREGEETAEANAFEQQMAVTGSDEMMTTGKKAGIEQLKRGWF